MEPGHSVKCTDRKTYLDLNSGKCVQCPIKKGSEAFRNCGYDDHGSRHEYGYKECPNRTFNDGSSAVCRSCTVCPPGHREIQQCTSENDRQCESQRTQRTEAPVTITTITLEDVGSTWVTPLSTLQTKTVTTSTHHSKVCPNRETYYDKDTGKCVPCPRASGAVETDCGFNRSTLPNIPTSTSQGSTSTPSSLWAVPLAVFVSFLVVLCVLVILKKQKRGQHVFRCCKRSLNAEKGFIPLFTTNGNKDPNDVLNPVILSAPLQSVLDNLDVLEELVILLDPESHGIKNTKHLASHCAFTSTWVTYTYSMKDSKSPLKAVLEGVTSKHPDWTVGHLAKLLILIERNDAVAVLAKLRLNSIAEFEGCTHM